jgi:hypothetical protein
LKIKSPAVLAGLFCFVLARDYRATRNFEIDVPICANAAAMFGKPAIFMKSVVMLQDRLTWMVEPMLPLLAAWVAPIVTDWAPVSV